MSEGCVFRDQCPMDADIIELSGPCESRSGEFCGPVAAYGMLVWQMEGLREDDLAAPIAGSFTFDTVPAGYPPQEIRQEWLGVSVPVRHTSEIGQGFVVVSPEDVVLSLLSQGRLKAASWFTKLVLQSGDFTATFRVEEGTYTESGEPVTSLEFYGARVDEDVRVSIENS